MSDTFSRQKQFRLENIQCHEFAPNDAGWYDRNCCWDQYDAGTGASMGTFCQNCTLRGDGTIVQCGNVTCPSGDCTWSRGQQLTNSTLAPEPDGVAPPPGPGKGGPGNVLPQTPQGLQTGHTPVPKSGLGNLLPEGVFGGPGTSPTQEEMTPEVAPPTGPEGDNETQGRIIGESPSPTGYCVPLRTPTCIPCDPGLPGADCIPQTEWPPIRTTDEGPIEEKPLIPPTTGLFEETAPQVAPPTGEDGAGQPTEPLCPEGQVLDEETGLCVLDESTAEQQEQAAEEPAESQPEEEQPTEESDSGDGGNN